MNMHMKGNELSWDDLAKLYDQHHPGGRPARTMPVMCRMFKWVRDKRDELGLCLNVDGTLSRIISSPAGKSATD
jgi:hypothetical protein